MFSAGAVDLSDQSRALVDEAGVELDQGGAGVEHGQGVVGGEDAADADDGQFSVGVLGNEGDDVACAGGEGAAGEAAGFGRGDAGAGQGGVGGDDAVDLV